MSQQEATPSASPTTLEELSPTLKQILDMSFHYTDAEYSKLAFTSKTSGTREVSEDTILKNLKAVIERKAFIGNAAGIILRVLERDSMKESPHQELFRKALQEVAGRDGYVIKIGIN